MLSLVPNPNSSLCPNLHLFLLHLPPLHLLQQKEGGGGRARARRLGGGRHRRLRALVALRGASRDSRHSCNAWVFVGRNLRADGERTYRSKM